MYVLLFYHAIVLMYVDVLLTSSTTKPRLQNANVFRKDRNWKEYQQGRWKKRANSAWEWGVVVKLISKTSSCIRAILLEDNFFCNILSGLSIIPHPFIYWLRKKARQRNAWFEFMLLRDHNQDSNIFPFGPTSFVHKVSHERIRTQGESHSSGTAVEIYTTVTLLSTLMSLQWHLHWCNIGGSDSIVTTVYLTVLWQQLPRQHCDSGGSKISATLVCQ